VTPVVPNLEEAQMNTIEAATKAAMKVKDMSPDFDPRDIFTIERECQAMATAVIEAVKDGLTSASIMAGQDAVPHKLSDHEVRQVFGACINMILRGQ
jgi:hypothetical protein